MANIQVGFQSTLTTGTDNFVAELQDASNLGVTVEAIVVPKTGGIYPPSFQVNFLTAVTLFKVYRVILWETAGTTPGGTARVSDDIPALLNSVNMMEPLYLTADVSTGLVSGTNTYVNTSLIGWNIWLEIPPTGSAFPGIGVDYTWDNTTGTLTYLLGNWNPSQRIIIHPEPQIAAAAPPPVSAITSGVIITTGRALVSGDKNKMLYIQSATSSIIMTLPSLSAGIADYDHIVANLNGGSHINAVFNTNGSDKIQYKGLITQLIGRQGEKIDLYKANGVWNIDVKPAGMDFVGEIVHRFTNTDINLIFADGSVLSRAMYPALFAYVQGLPSTAIATEVGWHSTTIQDGIAFFPNKGKWTMGDLSTTFRIPAIFNSGFLRAVDGVSTLRGQLQVSGNSEIDWLLEHCNDSMTGLFGSKPNGFGPVKTAGTYAGTVSTGTDLTGPMYNRPGAGNAGTLLQRIGTETHPTNLYIYASIRI